MSIEDVLAALDRLHRRKSIDWIILIVAGVFTLLITPYALLFAPFAWAVTVVVGFLLLREISRIETEIKYYEGLLDEYERREDVRPGSLAAMRLRGYRGPRRTSFRQVYSEYHMHKGFFQAARDGLASFAKRLDGDNNIPLTSNDLYEALLHAQKGLNKVEEYAEALTSQFGDESSPQKAVSMLAELRENQRPVITYVEQFYAKLEAVEGHTSLKDEFARWYVSRVEPHIVKPKAYGDAKG